MLLGLFLQILYIPWLWHVYIYIYTTFPSNNVFRSFEFHLFLHLFLRTSFRNSNVLRVTKINDIYKNSLTLFDCRPTIRLFPCPTSSTTFPRRPKLLDRSSVEPRSDDPVPKEVSWHLSKLNIVSMVRVWCRDVSGCNEKGIIKRPLFLYKTTPARSFDNFILHG